MRTKSADTIGIIADLTTEDGLILVNEIVRITGDPELRGAVEIALGSGMRFFIAAGAFNSKGLIATYCHDEQTLLAAFRMINERMKKAKSKTTAWHIAPSLHDLLQEVLK